ncbi:MAG: winged helix-turn-helix domain-containing protein [Pseudomonadota bacterium]
MDHWRLFEADRRLCNAHSSVPLTPKAAAVLACLVRRTGEVVSVREILENVWAGVFVTPDLVREYVCDLRRALGDDAAAPRYIETVRGKGFRLKGGISLASPTASTAAPSPRRDPQPMIAVLRPTVAGGPDAARFAEAFATDVINHLARFPDLGVVARLTSFNASEGADLRSFANAVDARYLLSLDVSAFAEELRIRVELVDGSSGRNVWADGLELCGRQLGTAVDTAVAGVVAALTGWNGELHRAEYRAAMRQPEQELDAYGHFIRGRSLDLVFEEESLTASLAHLEKAVSLEPTFARAWLTYAIMLRWAADILPKRAAHDLPRAREALATAHMLAPRDPMTLALVALGTARDGDLPAALAQLNQAKANLGNDADAMLCVATSTAVLTDDCESALALLEEGLRRNPAPPRWFRVVEARIAFLAGDYRRSALSARQGPQHLSSLIFASLSHAMLDEPDAAIDAYDDLTATYPQANLAHFASRFPIAAAAPRRRYDIAASRLQQLMGAHEERRRALPSLGRADPRLVPVSEAGKEGLALE